MPDIDLMVRILTDANTQGLGETQKAVEGVTGAVSESGGAATTSSNALQGLRGKMGDVRDVSQAAAAAARGDLGGALRELGGLANSSSEMLAKLGGAAGAAFMGFQLGGMLDQMFGLSDAIARLVVPLDNVERRARISTGELERMSKVRMDALASSLDDIDRKLSRQQSLMQAASQAQQDMIRAQAELDVARIERDMAPGADRDKAVLARRAKADQDASNVSLGASQEITKALETAGKELEAERERLTAERDAAAREYANLVEAAQKRKSLGLETSPDQVVQGSNARALADQAEKSLASFNEKFEQRMADIEARLTAERRAQQTTRIRQETAGVATGNETVAIDARVNSASQEAKRQELEQRVSQLEQMLRDAQSGGKQGIGKLQEQAAREQSEADAARQAYDELKGQRPRELGRTKKLQDLRIEAQQQQQEADQAAAALESAQQALDGKIRNLTAALKRLEQMVQNLPDMT